MIPLHLIIAALADSSEPPPFVVAQPQPPAVQLRLEDTVLFSQESDDVALLAFEPAEQRNAGIFTKRTCA